MIVTMDQMMLMIMNNSDEGDGNCDYADEEEEEDVLINLHHLTASKKP